MGLSAKEIARLSLSARRQVTKQSARNRETHKGGNKYHAKPTEVALPDGTVRRFSSEKEANRFRELSLLERAGEIFDLRCQVPYELVPRQTRADGKREQPVRYIADFVYRQGRELVVEDVKGYADPKNAAYKLFTVKRKLMLQVYGITVKEV